MKTFGITGGIGMGKSTAAAMLRERGVPVIDTDEVARQVVEIGRPALSEIKAVFGDHMLNPDGSLNRQKLAALVFADDSDRTRLEAILHPRIQQVWETQLAGWRAEGRAVAAVVIPLLFETNVETNFDAVICLACSETTQAARLVARGWLQDEIARRIAAQMSVIEKMSRADLVVWTEGNVSVTGAQLERIFFR